MMPAYFCVDIGGTKTAWALYGEDGSELCYRRFPTEPERGAEDLVKRVYDDARATVREFRILGACIASPGPLEAEKGRIVKIVTMGWENVEIAALFEGAFGFPFLLLNDCDAGALGVAASAAFRSYRTVCYMSLSTGIGGGSVIGGALFTGRGNAADFGHIPVPGKGLKCGCGRTDCLELYASGSGLENRYAAASGEKKSCAEIERLAKAGDPLASSLYREAADALAFAGETIRAIMDPDILVLGGSVCRSGEILVGKLASRHTVGYAPDDGKQVLLGACAFAKQHYQSNRGDNNA